ncbi:MAG: S9 family peptidase [Bacteroidales bacterium]|nr:S9 family peptidase [Bacteroidales bacterium]
MKRLLFILLIFSASLLYGQKITTIEQMNYAGPFAVSVPKITDSLGVNGKPFKNSDLLNSVSENAQTSGTFSSNVIPSLRESMSISLFTFYINNQNFTKADIKVKGPKNYKVYLNGKEASGKLKLEPKNNKIVIKTLSEAGASDSLKVTLEGQNPIAYQLSSTHSFGLDDMLYGKRTTGSAISEDGKWIIVNYSETGRNGRARTYQQLKELASGRLVEQRNGMRWFNGGNYYCYEEITDGNRKLIKCNPATGEKITIAENIPQGAIFESPAEDYLIIAGSEEGPKEDPDVYQILMPDDRQPGWRRRSYIQKMDLKTGVVQRLTFGNRSSRVFDISADGKSILYGTSSTQIQKRPLNVVDICVMDAATLKVDTIIKHGEFIDGASFSPDGKKLLVSGSPEAFDGIGSQLPKGQPANMYDKQLYLYDITTGRVTPLTKEFNPSISRVVWSRRDNLIYASVTEGEYVTFYSINPSNGKIKQIPLPVEVMGAYSLPEKGSMMSYVGSGATSPLKLYLMDMKSHKSSLLEDCSKEQYKDVVLGECKPWSFRSRLGDTIQGRFYLPPDFDASKKYPLIVNYYGGCTPTTRGLEGRYPQEYYASLGYVVYVLQPSGAIGFGQKFSARHVETWGKYVADDIIEGVKKFCDEHPYVNREKIGCIGASYGGFMTQYLQTVTDIFACAISHAGISNIASYWGEGYWGYSYGHVASAESYPWNNPKMYTEQSPLFNADKIHTPLLLLHGASDTNVPHIESIQMFTALKILGRDVAFVEVKGEDHWILEYSKRIKWSNTIMAWFQKYLKDDSSWWDELYSPKSL